jgi:hypothetical protein
VNCIGGTVTTSGANTVHTFTTVGTASITCATGKSVNYLIVAGGGGGGGTNTNVGGGAGGAGGLLQGTGQFLAGGATIITIGSGGNGSVPTAFPTSGGGSSIASIGTAVGGGAGGTYLYGGSSQVAAAGGSGGGGWYNSPGGAGTAGQGFAGGAGVNSTPNQGGGGGGGCGAVGTNSTSTTGGNGGVGCTSSITGSSVCYAGGGGAGTYNGGTAGTATCGGGAGAPPSTTAVSVGFPGSANTGGGGGGASTGAGVGTSGGNGGSGGSGVVIVSYATGSTQPPPPCAPNTDGGGAFANVVGLWHMDNANTDNSAAGTRGLTLNGTAAYSTTQAKFGGYSLKIVASGDYAGFPGTSMSIPGDLTAEAWLYMTAVPASYFGWIGDDQATNLLAGSIPQLYMQVASTTTQITATISVFTPNAWHHVAWERQGGNLRIFLDGVEQAGSPKSGVPTSTVGGTATTWKIGRAYVNTYMMPANSYIDEVRVSNIARYTANFTPQTTAFCNN